jgi:hypothetical protein
MPARIAVYEYTNYLMSSGAATGASALHSAYASWLRAP